MKRARRPVTITGGEGAALALGGVLHVLALGFALSVGPPGIPGAGLAMLTATCAGMFYGHVLGTGRARGEAQEREQAGGR